VAVCAGYLALAITFNFLTPAWENNDEPDHVDYIEHVVRHGTPPRIAIANGFESHQPPLYYYATAAWQGLLGIGPFTPHVHPPPGSAIPPTKRVWELSHAYSPSEHKAAIWVHLLRLASTACGLAAVLAALATGWLLTRRTSVAAALGATVALWPKFLVVTSAVTNSALAIALCACAVPAFLLWQRSREPKWAAAVGVVIGAGGLTEETALPVAGLMLLVLIGYAWRERDWRSPLLAIGCFVAVCGWWYIRDAILYGDPLASKASRIYLENIPGLVRNRAKLSLSVISHSLRGLFHSTWYDGGANQLLLPSGVNLAVWIIAGASLIASIWSRMSRRPVLIACALASLITWLVIIRATTQAEGRYLLVGVVAWSAFLLAGSTRIMGGRAVALAVWPAIFIALDVYVLANWLVPYAHL
jgi:hypothetical protein